jgi:hypothetical protein
MDLALVEMKTTVFSEGKRMATSCQESLAAAGYRFWLTPTFGYGEQ